MLKVMEFSGAFIKYLVAMSGDIVRLVVFLAVTGGFYYLAAHWWLAWWWRKKARRAGVPDTGEETWRYRLARNRMVGGFLLLYAFAGMACVGYGFTIGPNRLTVAHYTIPSEKVPVGRRVRVVHLADLHVREDGPREKRLPTLVEDLHPDFIVNTGDFWGSRDPVEDIVLRLVTSWKVPHYFCVGNMDYLGDVGRLVEEGGLHRLNGTAARIEIRGIPFTIAGFSGELESRMSGALSKLPADTVNIVLCHHPSAFPGTWDTPADVMFAGHIHGGQVRVPGFGAVITLDRFGKRWEYGHYFERGIHLIVSRGIGCELFMPEFRVNCPPEVVVVDFVGK